MRTIDAVLKISEKTLDSFHEEGLEQLSKRIIAHWQKDLRRSGQIAGPEGRAEIIEDVKARSREERDLTDSDLTIIADLLLVEKVNQLRAAKIAETLRSKK